MEDKKQGRDAADDAPRPGPKAGEKPAQPGEAQDAKNYEKRTDGGRSIEDEDLSSANDE